MNDKRNSGSNSPKNILNEAKLPTFKYTPAPPPPPSKDGQKKQNLYMSDYSQSVCKGRTILVAIQDSYK